MCVVKVNYKIGGWWGVNLESEKLEIKYLLNFNGGGRAMCRRLISIHPFRKVPFETVFVQ